jgi:hypothetical protein
MKIAIAGVLISASMLTGCALPMTQQATRPWTAPTISQPTPRCGAPIECERMWLASQESIQRLTGMRLRLVSENRAETFAPTSLRQMTGGTVLKFPVAPGEYEFRADIYCYGHMDCNSLRASGINAFNSAVNLAADRPTPRPAAPPSQPGPYPQF